MAPRSKNRNPISEYLAEIGRRGGEAQNPAKGFGSMSPARKKEVAKKAADGRRRAAAARKKVGENS